MAEFHGTIERVPESLLLSLLKGHIRSRLTNELMAVAKTEVDKAVDASMNDLEITIRRDLDQRTHELIVGVSVKRTD